MEILESIILGIIQGITEFLPVSSSGHLVLMPKIFGWTDQGLAYDAVIHLATGLAIVLALRKDLFSKEFWYNKKLLFFIFVAIVPAGLVGFFFGNWIELKTRAVELVAFNLILWGAVLFISERVGKMNVADKKNINWKQSLTLGLMQVLAFLPGTSRSGITITGGLFSGLDRKTAVKFSFLVGLPLILAAGGMKIVGIVQDGLAREESIVLFAGFVSAFLSGILAIKLLVWIAEKASFKWFVIYRIILGIALLWFFV